jgi:4-hydroxy-3-methylbut-2-en-1-yl diphosphate synthase IspG/GcpE
MRAINSGEYRVDGFHNMRVSAVDEYYFLCPKCGRILFDDIEAADKSLKGLPITEDE